MTTFEKRCIISILIEEFREFLLYIFAVEAYIASWIEIKVINLDDYISNGRGLYSLVD